MTDTPKKLVIDATTGEQAYIDMTSEEIAQRELDAIASATRRAEEQAQIEATEALKESARLKLTTGEPLTAEEAAVVTP